jgi:hypothetical protein
MDIGSLFLILALALAVGLFIAQPFLNSAFKEGSGRKVAFEARDHVRSALLAEREQVLDALQELDFDQALGKNPRRGLPLSAQPVAGPGRGRAAQAG